jgi:uncharacterized delta-60 repeat protein
MKAQDRPLLPFSRSHLSQGLAVFLLTFALWLGGPSSIANGQGAGSLDTNFNPGLVRSGYRPYVFSVVVQPDGKIVIGGIFTAINGVARNGIARLNADGSLDSSFDPGTGAEGSPNAAGNVSAMVVQPDGKIVIGGFFTAINGVKRQNIARLNADGSLDASFDPGTGVEGGQVSTMAVQPDGKIVIGGDFTAFNGGARNSIVRLNGDPPPTITLLTDLNNRALAAGSTVTLSAAASDFLLGKAELARVEFYADGVLFASFDSTGNPVTSFYGPAGNGPMRRSAGDPVGNKTVFQAVYQLPGVDKLINIIVRAVDKLGSAHDSSPVTVHSVVTADRPPTVTLGLPSGGKRVRVGAPIKVPVAVNDPDSGNTSSVDPTRPVRRAIDVSGVIKQVEYYVNQLKAKTVTAAPFDDFGFTPPAAGTYVVTVIATDGSGLAQASDPLTIVAASGVNLSVLGDGTAVEGGARGKVLFSRPGDTTGDLTVYYKMKGTAKNGVDYESLSGQLVIPAGSDKFKLKIKPIDDALQKGTRKITIQLLPSLTEDYDLGDSTKAKLLLLDND